MRLLCLTEEVYLAVTFSKTAARHTLGSYHLSVPKWSSTRSSVLIPAQVGTSGFKWRGWSNGCKNENPKESHAEFPRLKNIHKAKKVWLYFFTLVAELSRPGYAGTTTNLQIDVNTPENPYLNQARPNFPTQKGPGIENFKLLKILRSSPSIKIRSTPPPPLSGHTRCFMPNCLILERLSFMYTASGKRQIQFGNEQIKTAQNNSYG